MSTAAVTTRPVNDQPLWPKNPYLVLRCGARRGSVTSTVHCEMPALHNQGCLSLFGNVTTHCGRGNAQHWYSWSADGPFTTAKPPPTTGLVTVRLDLDLIAEMDERIAGGMYSDRSAVIEDALRRTMSEVRSHG